MYEMNGTEKLYIEKCAEMLGNAYGKEYKEHLLSVVNSVREHAYQRGRYDGYSSGVDDTLYDTNSYY